MQSKLTDFLAANFILFSFLSSLLCRLVEMELSEQWGAFFFFCVSVAVRCLNLK